MESVRYEELKRLGSGSYGHVLLAKDRWRDELVAVKVFRSSAGNLDTLLREPRVLAKLNHPNIVRLLEIQEIEGRVCFVMEYLAGGSLRDLLTEWNREGKRAPVSQVLQIASQICRGLAGAHEQRIVHLDVKPGNILFTENREVAKLGDFGVAAFLSTAGRDDDQTGTLGYMPREALAGVKTVASDVYAIGIVAYECLAGRPPFMAGNMHELVKAIERNEPPPLRRFSPDVPPEVEEIVMNAIQPDVRDRTPSARALLSELEAYLRRGESHGQSEAVPDEEERFVLTRSLGVGAFGEVYLAEDLWLRETVALKVPRQNPEDLDAYLQEARILRKLGHPNIVELIEIERFRGKICFALEYVEGHSLRKPLRDVEDGKAALPEVEVAIGVILKAAAGLAAAHRAQILHRDVKPENILVSRDLEVVKVTDFGVSRLLPEGVASTVAGTLYYMAAEVLQGKGAFVSDVHSLGVVAYEYLSGRRPFEGKTPKLIMDAIFAGNAAPLKELRPDIPVALSKAVHRAISPDLSVRYPSMDAFADELRSFVRTAETPEPDAQPSGRLPPTKRYANLEIVGERLWKGIDVLTARPVLLAAFRDEAEFQAAFADSRPYQGIVDPGLLAFHQADMVGEFRVLVFDCTDLVTLRSILSSGGLKSSRAVEIAGQVAEALARLGDASCPVPLAAIETVLIDGEGVRLVPHTAFDAELKIDREKVAARVIPRSATGRRAAAVCALLFELMTGEDYPGPGARHPEIPRPVEWFFADFELAIAEGRPPHPSEIAAKLVAIDLSPGAILSTTIAEALTLGKRDFPAAVNLLRRLLGDYPGSADLHSALGDLYLEHGDLSWAIREHEKAVRAGSDPGHRVRLGIAYFRAEDYARARQELELAVEGGAADAATLQFLALAARQSGRTDLAIKSARRSLEISPEQARLKRWLRSWERSHGAGSTGDTP